MRNVDPLAEISFRRERLLGEASLGDAEARRCLEIERHLSEVEYDGLPLGATITDPLGSILYRGTMQPGLRLLIASKLAFCAHRLVGTGWRPRRAPSPRLTGGRILVSNVGNRDYMRKVVPSLVSELGPRACMVLANDPLLLQALPAGTERLAWTELPPLDLKSWRCEVRPCLRRIRQAVTEARREFAFSRATAAVLEDVMLTSSQKIWLLGNWLDQVRPLAVLVDFDRNVNQACLVLAAKRRGIPSMTLVHGAINGPFGFTPVLADAILCWGETQRRQLIDLGTDPGDIEIVGFDRLRRSSAADRGDVRRKMNVDGSEAVVLLATNPIEMEDRWRLSRIFCSAVRSAGLRGFVRLHPSESLGAYEAVCEEFPEIRFMANNELSADESFALADVVVGHSTAFGSEALVRGCLVVVLDALARPLGHGGDLVKMAGVPRVVDAEELCAVLRRSCVDEPYRRTLLQSAVRYTEQMYAALGDDAIRRTAQVVRCAAGQGELNRLDDEMAGDSRSVPTAGRGFEQ